MSKLIPLIPILVVALCSCMKAEKCDLVIHNAKIYSLNGTNDVFEAIAIKNGRILELGPEREIMNKYSYTSSYDASLNTIFPGFIDAHCHFVGYGLGLQQAQLSVCNSFEEVLQTLLYHSEKLSTEWLIGRGWDHTKWPENEYPNKAALDSLFPNIPVLIRRVDGHAALANSLALQRAGITEKSKIKGGHIEVLDGELTGILVDKAVDSIMKLIPAPTKDQLIQAMLLAQENCFKVGLTTVDDAGLSKKEIDVIQELQDQGTLKMRIYAMLSDNQENFDHYLKTGPIKTDRLNVRSFKFYGDGALGSRGACLLQAYQDSPTSFGMLLSDKAYFKKWAEKLYKAGFQMNTHCIGDSATRIILDVYGDVLKRANDKRWRVEHAQLVHGTDISQFGKFNIIPSVQPTHATSDMRWAALRIGLNRLKYCYAYEDLRKQNGIIALGTDFPVEDISPIATFYAAVIRKSTTDKSDHKFQPENALSKLNALKGMTTWAATANFEESEKGTLEKGKFADLVVLNRDLLTCSEEEILNTKVLRTYINGVCVHER